MRLFVGTFVDPAEKQRIENFQKGFRDPERFSLRIAWVKEEKLHQTWCFLGEVQESTIPDIVTALEQARENFLTASKRSAVQQSKARGAYPKLLSVKFDSPEIWPHPRQPRSLVVRPSEASKDFECLARSIRESVRDFCAATHEQHDTFKPHLTIARFRPRSLPTPSSGDSNARRREASVTKSNCKIGDSAIDSGAVGQKPTLADFEDLVQLLPVELQIRRFELIRSHIGREKEAYESLQTFTL